jgi:hypothetical protein
MALTGTLKDFGIADILQLIGQQQKTGLLNLETKDHSVQIHFVDGNVVKAASATRSKQDLLGTMMVRAKVLTENQLEQALAIQKRTLRRLGDILIGEGFVEKETFQQMYQLQTTETLYKLFHWKDGTYAFEQQEVDYDPEAVTPIRSENALMEGFRMVDEWPMVRKTISSYEMTFRRLKDLGPAEAAPGVAAADDDDPFASVDAAFSAMEAGEAPPDDDDGPIGPYERRVLPLVAEGVTVQQIVDVSRIGEFETCKALLNLVQQGYLEAVAPAKSARPMAGTGERDLLGALRRGVAHLAVGAAVLVGVALLSYLALGATGSGAGVFVPRGGQDVIARQAQARLESALAVYRLDEGELPGSLDTLVEAGLLGRRDLVYPYGRAWYYRVAEDEARGYVLLPPVP